MNKSEEDCKIMLNSFRIIELQSLLGAFRLNNIGRKTELNNRALEFLKNKSAVNHQAFVAKIIEIYNSNHTNCVRPNQMQNQWLKCMPVDMQQAQSTRLYIQSPHNPQQYISIPQTAPSQVRLGIQRDISGSIQIQNNYGSAVNKLHQVPLNKQINTVTTNNITNDSSDAKFFIPSPQSLAKIKLRRLPFYDVISEIIKPCTLVGQPTYTLPNPPLGAREEFFKFILLSEQATHIGMNRDISNGKNDYIYQLQIRICLFESGSIEITDFLPLGLHIRVGNLICPLPPSAKPGTETRRIPQPIDCTTLAKLNPSMVNTIHVNWIPDAKTYVMGVYLVKKVTPEKLFQQLINKELRSSEETKNHIMKKLADVDPDLTTTSYRFSLVCPIGKMRMKIPAKSTTCDHLQCFDACTYILMNDKKSTWMCPTCSQPCLFDNIQIESYFLEVINSPKLPDNCKEIEILADGTWKVCKEDPVGTEANAKEKPVDCINLDSDEEYVAELKIEDINYPESLKETEKLKTCLIDLTLSDNDEPTEEEDKQKNEAQAADFAQPVVELNVKPSALVQPQQAVTSSEQEMIIEIDSSPSPPSSPTHTTLQL